MKNKIWALSLTTILLSTWAISAPIPALTTDSVLPQQQVQVADSEFLIKVSKISPVERINNKLEKSRRIRESKRLKREQDRREKAAAEREKRESVASESKS